MEHGTLTLGKAAWLVTISRDMIYPHRRKILRKLFLFKEEESHILLCKINPVSSAFHTSWMEV